VEENLQKSKFAEKIHRILSIDLLPFNKYSPENIFSRYFPLKNLNFIQAFLKGNKSNYKQ
jgi:hypothetical protein